MELFFPLLGLLLVELTGWLFGLYLFLPWGRSLKGGNPFPVWSVIWAIGWLIQPAGWGLRTVGLLSSWGIVGTVLVYLSPILWLVAFVIFRRGRTTPQLPLPRQGDPQTEGIWPPPPKP